MLSSLRRRFRGIRESFPTVNNMYEWARGRKFPIFLEFPVRPRPRWGYAAPAYDPVGTFLARYDGRYRDAFTAMAAHRESFADIPRAVGGDPRTPAWVNGTFPALDAMALYTFLVRLNPARYVEIGSGNSTKFARYAISRHDLKTRIVSIDPRPRAEVDALCDERCRGLLEDQDLSLFSQLEAGDILFLDGSHFGYQNSDIVIFFLDILPRLRPGVWVQIHDINWPLDYGPESVDRYFSEQYLLAAYSIGGASRMDVQLANHYAFKQMGLGAMLEDVFSAPALAGVPRIGASFWFSIAGPELSRT